MILTAILMSHNNISAQTYDSITKQGEIFKNNPQLGLGGTAGGGFHQMMVNPSTNQIYVTNSEECND
jgi:hypothetical protein